MSTFPSDPALKPFHDRDQWERGPIDHAALPRILNLAEAATVVRCSRAHLSNIIHGKVPGIPYLPTVRIGRRVLFRRESLEQWLEKVEAFWWGKSLKTTR